MCIMGGDDIRIVEAVLKPPSYSHSEICCPEFQSIYLSNMSRIYSSGSERLAERMLSINALNKKLIAGINHFSTGGSFMRKLSQVLLFFVVIGVIACMNNGASAEETIAEAVEKEMPVLKGDQWVAMDENSKVAFIWGAGHVVTIEEVIMERYPDQKRDTFVAKVVEASTNSPMTMSQVAAMVDKFYQDNPDKTDTPVMAVIWDTMIKPNIKTGIGGKPLN